MMKSIRLRKLDELENQHLQAWLNHVVKNTKTHGKKTVPVFKTYKSFFDREKLEAEIKGKKDDPAMDDFKKLVAKANSQKGGG